MEEREAEESAREVGVLIIGLEVVVAVVVSVVVVVVMLVWQLWPFLGRPQRPQL